MFYRAVDWYYSGSDNGRLTNYIINDAGRAKKAVGTRAMPNWASGARPNPRRSDGTKGWTCTVPSTIDCSKDSSTPPVTTLGNTVPFVPSIDTTGNYHQTAISPIDRGLLRPIYEMVYNHYKFGVVMPAPTRNKPPQRSDRRGPR